MPYPNEHAGRLANASDFEKIRRVNNKFGNGIHAIFGIKNGKTTLISVRFSRSKFTAEEAKSWLKKHFPKASFHPAASEKGVNFASENNPEGSLYYLSGSSMHALRP